MWVSTMSTKAELHAAGLHMLCWLDIISTKPTGFNASPRNRRMQTAFRSTCFKWTKHVYSLRYCTDTWKRFLSWMVGTFFSCLSGYFYIQATKKKYCNPPSYKHYVSNINDAAISLSGNVLKVCISCFIKRTGLRKCFQYAKHTISPITSL